MKTLIEIRYNHRNRLDAYIPETERFPCIVWFHGGGLEGGDKAEGAGSGLAERFVRAGYAFVSANYRLYPEAKYPEYLYDAAEAVSFVRERLRGWQGSGEIIVAGRAAGAWLAAMLALNGRWLSAAGTDPGEISGWMLEGGQMASHGSVIKYEQGYDPRLQRIDEYAPLFYIGPETSFSRMLLVCRGEEKPCRAEQNMLLCQSVRSFCPQADISFVRTETETAFFREALRWLRR